MKLVIAFSLGLLGLNFAACTVRNVRPPVPMKVQVGTSTAGVRDFRGGGVCEAEGGALASELESLNMLLANFLGATSGGPEGAWADEHLDALQAGQKQLPPVLGAMDHTWTTLPTCRHPESFGLGELTRKGQELARQTRRRLEEAPYLHAYVTYRRERDQWMAGVKERQETARESTCTGPMKRAAEPYFASENEKGEQVFEFCDGAKVQRAIGKAPEVTPPPPPKKKKKKVEESPDYLAEILDFPAAQIERAPRAPSRLQSRRAADADDDAELNEL